MQQAHDELREALTALWHEARTHGVPFALGYTWFGMVIMLIVTLIA